MLFKPTEITCDSDWHTKLFASRHAEFLGYMRVRDPGRWGYWCIETHQYGRMAAIVGFYGHPDNDDFEPRMLPGYAKPHFTFDSEHTFVMPKGKKSYSAQNVSQEYLERNQYVLFFVGCDDGSKGLRFKSKSEAMLFLDHFDFFDDFIDICETHN